MVPLSWCQAILCNCDSSLLQTVDWQTLFSYMPQPMCCDLTLWPLISLNYIKVQCHNVRGLMHLLKMEIDCTSPNLTISSDTYLSTVKQVEPVYRYITASLPFILWQCQLLHFTCSWPQNELLAYSIPIRYGFWNMNLFYKTCCCVQTIHDINSAGAGWPLKLNFEPSFSLRAAGLSRLASKFFGCRSVGFLV